MKKVVVWLLIFALVLSLIAMVASAESVSNTWVYDESDYISELTEKHIEEINTNRHWPFTSKVLNYESWPLLTSIIPRREFRVEIRNDHLVLWEK